MPRPTLWLVVALGATTLACPSNEENSCHRLELLWQKEAAGVAESSMGKTKEVCLQRVDKLIVGKRECMVRCYDVATSVGNIFDCDRKCGI